ncbi:MAG: YARHG domain-containing protein [Bacteroidetes bacterium]|nr:YARHG domain-containing protein [Bacteroidota bacterium]
MRKAWLILLAGGILIACNNDKKTDSPSGDKTEDTTATTNGTNSPIAAVNFLDKLLGSFVGAFGDNKITLLITKVQGDSILGRSIVGGNDRPFAGTIIKSGGSYTVVAKEPGDDPNDGIFNFSIAESNPDSVSGSWKPNNAKKPAKAYSLGRKQFEYRNDVGSYPEASQRLLKAKDVENMYKEELELMRNEIFARHGFCFKKKNLRQTFEVEDWYVPNTVDIKDMLTDIEKKNIELIKRYEKYAEEYGDEYGR